MTDDGLLIVSERDGNCITVLDKEGEKIWSFGFHGTGRGQLKKHSKNYTRRNYNCSRS